MLGALFTKDEVFHRRVLDANLWDPRWNVTALGSYWICPFCCRTGVENAEKSEDLADDIVGHLQEDCPSCNAMRGTIASLADLRRVALNIEIRVSLAKNDLWHFRDAAGRWHCPFCGDSPKIENQFITLVNPVGPKTFAMVEEHLRHCVWYARGQGTAKTKSEMTSVVALANREWQFAEKVKQKLQSDAAWQEKDGRNHWICPWCEVPVENIDISSTFLLLETAPLQISHHLMHHCEPFRTGGADATGEVHGHGDPEEEAMKENMEAASRDMAHFQVSQRKLFAARSRQQSAALPPPSVQGLDIGAVHEPGSEIAGDFYCFVPLEDERLGIAIGDVAGHGPEATTAMLEARRILDTCADGQRSPGKVLAAVNRELSHWKWPETFVSMAYVVLDTSNRRVTVARAGHAPLLLFRAHAQHTPPIVQVAPPGMILGVIGEGFREKIAETRVALQPKDILLLTSFGIPDCPNLSGERFGMQRTARVLKRYCNAPARDLLKHVCKAARTHAQGREVRDDLTAIAVRVV